MTICIRKHKCVLGKIINREVKLSEIGKIAQNCWLKIPDHFDNVILDKFIIMPNHMHGIIIINNNKSLNSCRGLINQTPTDKKWILMKNQDITLGKIIRCFKAKTTHEIHKSGFQNFQWQRNYYEHVIRDEKDLNKIREYIIYNYLKWYEDDENPGNIKK